MNQFNYDQALYSLQETLDGFSLGQLKETHRVLTYMVQTTDYQNPANEVLEYLANLVEARMTIVEAEEEDGA